MTYQQLLPVYQQLTGLPGQDDAFNQWVQGIINASGSQQGVEGIPDNWFNTPAGQQYVGQTGGGTGGTGGTSGFGSLTPVTPPGTGTDYTPATVTSTGGNYNQDQTANQAGQFATVGNTLQNQVGESGQTQNTTQNVAQNQTSTSEQNTAQSNTYNQNTLQNTNQTQSGVTNQQTAQNTGYNQNTAQNTNQSQNTTTGGAQSSYENSIQNAAGVNTTNTIDTLRFGNLLRDQANMVGTSDAARNSFLQDTMQTGGTGFASQIDAAIRNSLTGAQMTGAGDSARARASGYAAANVARNNLDQRLAAAQQLSGPTGMATLSTAANPFLGKSEVTNQSVSGSQQGATQNTQATSSNTQGNTTGMTSGGSSSTTESSQQMFNNLVSAIQGINSGTNSSTGTTTGTNTTTGNTATTGTSDTTGFSNLTSTGAESSAGSTTGQASQAGAGNIPQGQPVKTGGCVLCTAAIELGLSKHHRTLRKVIRHKLHVDSKRFSSAARGYFALFTPVAAWLLDHPRLARVLFPMAKAVVYEELRVAGRELPFKPWPFLVHWTGHYACATIDSLFRLKGCVTHPKILEIARREGILYELKEGAS